MNVTWIRIPSETRVSLECMKPRPSDPAAAALLYLPNVPTQRRAWIPHLGKFPHLHAPEPDPAALAPSPNTSCWWEAHVLGILPPPPSYFTQRERNKHTHSQSKPEASYNTKLSLLRSEQSVPRQSGINYNCVWILRKSGEPTALVLSARPSPPRGGGGLRWS